MPELTIGDAMGRDARHRTLHLLPALLVDPFDRVARADISLSVSVSWLDVPIAPSSGWTIRQPYPNKLYFVGGSAGCHLGHFVTLPERQQAGEVTFHWAVSVTGSPSRHSQVFHRLDLTFTKGVGRTYSMDVANWWSLSDFAKGEHSTPEIGRNRFTRLTRQGISPGRRAHADEAIRDGCRYLDIHESLTLPAITLKDCWTIEAFGGDTACNCLEALR